MNKANAHDLFVDNTRNLFAPTHVIREVTALIQYVGRKTGAKMGEEKDIHTIPDLMKHMKFISDKYKLKGKKHVPLEPKILSRRMEEFGFCTHPVEDKASLWKQKYDRKEEVKKTGYLSVNYEPYEDVGQVEEDAVQLFLSCFKDYLKRVPKFNYNLNGAVRKPSSPPRKVDQKLIRAAEIEMCDILEREKSCKDGGLRIMKQTLADTSRRIVATSAGQSYARHVQQCQAEKEARRCLSAEAREDGGMKLQSLGSELLHPVASYAKISTRETAAPDKTNVISKAAESDKQSFLRFKQERKLQAVSDKLHYIYVILCSIYNMKSRYLKNKQPLTTQTVKSLRRDPFARRVDEIRSRGAAVRTCSMDTVGSRMDTRRTSTSRHSGEGPSRLLPAIPPSDRRHSGFRNQAANQLLKMGMSQTPSKLNDKDKRDTRSRLQALLGSAQDAAVKIETWEDLLSLGAKTKLLKLIRLKALPPWQQQLSSDEPVTSKKEQDEAHMDTYHSEEALGRIRAGWLRVKERSQKSVRQDMEKVDRERMVKFGYKMTTFEDVDPLFERQREYLRLAARDASKDPVLITETIVPWYEDLKRECVKLGVRTEAKVVEYLSKIEKFILEDVQNIPFAKFVLTEILEGNATMLKEWLVHRKLYAIV